MTKAVKLIGITMFVILLVSSYTACSSGEGTTSPLGDGGNGVLSGTYEADYSSITFSGSNWTMNTIFGDFGGGTYTVNGTTLTLTLVRVTAVATSLGAKVGDVDVWTIINNTTLRDNDMNELYIKK